MNNGILNLDCSVYCPSICSEDIVFFMEKDGEKLENQILKTPFPNKNVYLVSKKRGHGYCRSGYPIELPLNEEVKLVLKIVIGIKREQEYTLKFVFTISVRLTNEQPYSHLKIKFDDVIGKALCGEPEINFYLQTEAETEENALCPIYYGRNLLFFNYKGEELQLESLPDLTMRCNSEIPVIATKRNWFSRD